MSKKPLEPLDIERLVQGICPDCLNDLTRGPRGGAAQNMLCYSCLSRFNTTPGVSEGPPWNERLPFMSEEEALVLKGLYPPKRKKIEKVMVFRNGNVAVFDEEGKQIPELQTNLIRGWAEWAAKLGFDPNGLKVEIQGQSLITATVEIFRTSEGRFNLK